jgi:glycerol-3-phosphate dehydrogenase
MGTHLGLGLYAKEVEFLREYEWARTAEDILWRRTKLGLHDSSGDLTRTLVDFLKTIQKVDDDKNKN